MHAGQVPDPVTGSRALPIHQTTAYVFPDADAAAGRFAGTQDGFTYGRLNNPTQAAVEERITALEGGAAGLLVASGQAAVVYTVLTLAHAGDHLVSSPSLYGGTRTLFAQNLRKRGITTTFVDDPGDPAAWARAVRPRTKAFFAESLPNPRGDVLDIEAVAAVAHRAGVPLVVDNTVGTPYLVRPIEWGADVVVHSASKFLAGHGAALAGSIVDAGRFDYGADPQRWPDFTSPVPGYGDLVIARDFGASGWLGVDGVDLSFIVKARLEQAHDIGAAVAPFTAFLVAQGLETLSLRMERHVANAGAVARWLDARPDVASVTYSGLPGSPWAALARRYTPRGPGAIVGLELPGGERAGRAFVSALRLHSHVANIGDVRSLVIHPASTTHGQLSAAEQLQAGITPGFVRLSVGIEDLDDILEDLDVGFEAVRALGLAGVAPAERVGVVGS
ncbi:bifunctional o-acetylhomoserine/o-acetylserine sulfhydrylase [Cellulomonas soli]|uniref:homocysteine desulfhydrase n=1 Tax=Cellulomonas soli TaxID=931535 RepID=A0A512PAC9_9CELL|nr:bifunctional o-acetylhomoserine/o-acetylserine sulfhydrylase [Cellulomonas soli]